ncbi:hypothetical protein CRV08_14165 [Halarcobacter ebronensis]|uniref:TonB C-terminal domain-containing protein n=1 Tax=Halarcobacter ebronensis TaxID=1462615 RepID=A0A4Q0Y7V1_9BACT|nr:TonB family protein [Halarcobacter ebronensis]RXJ65885.1 hypothetical protein CRV08_14165 [Halarcobacter ebronensis]
MRYLGSFLISLFLYGSLIFAVAYNNTKPSFSNKTIEEKRVVKISLLSPPIKEGKKQLDTPIIEEKKILKKEKEIEKRVEKKVLKKSLVKKEETLVKKLPEEKKICETPIKDSLEQEKQKKVEPKSQVASVSIASIKNEFLAKVKSKINQNKIYPDSAKRRGIQGDTKVSFEIFQNGSVDNIKLLQGNKIFKKAVFNAIQDSFPIKTPTQKDIFPLIVTLKIEFKLH